MTNQTTGQHTPTPWNLQTLRVSLVPVMIRVNGYTKETAEANAAFIVRACNSHDALVGALQDFIDAATESSKNESYKANAYGFMMAVLPKARAALTAVTKK